MQIRKATEQDLDRIMEIFARARAFMAENGNPRQWAEAGWPPEELIRTDIEEERSFVCTGSDGRIIGTFCLIYGKDIEPTYEKIYDGEWIDVSPYGVVHRIASDGSEPGVGTFCIDWAWEQCRHLRMDTHGDNIVMQNLLEKLGFERCGIIYVKKDNDPRIAYERTELMDEFWTVIG